MHIIKILVLIGVLSHTSPSIPTKYTCRTAHLHLETSNRFTDVIADNNQVYSELDPNTGAVTFTGLTRSFEFKLGALDQAFNSSKVDLSQYTKFNYEGKVNNFKSINFDKPGSYNVEVKGTLFMGSYKRLTSAKGTVVVQSDGTLKTNSDFSIRIEEESMKTINDLMKQKLPSVIALDTKKLGISRDIKIKLTGTYRPK